MTRSYLMLFSCFFSSPKYSIIGLSDATDNKQVASAVITEPVNIADPSIVYIDDGSGFQPSYTGQSVDLIIDNATGNEEFVQLANFPIPRPQIVNTEDGPYELDPVNAIVIT